MRERLTGAPIIQLCQMTALRASSRCTMRAHSPPGTHPPWRSRPSWSREREPVARRRGDRAGSHGSGYRQRDLRRARGMGAHASLHRGPDRSIHRRSRPRLAPPSSTVPPMVRNLRVVRQLLLAVRTSGPRRPAARRSLRCPDAPPMTPTPHRCPAAAKALLPGTTAHPRERAATGRRTAGRPRSCPAAGAARPGSIAPDGPARWRCAGPCRGRTARPAGGRRSRSEHRCRPSFRRCARCYGGR